MRRDVPSRRRAPRGGRRLGIEVTPSSLIAADIRGHVIARAVRIPMPPTSPVSAVPVKNLLALERVGQAPVHLVTCDTEHVHQSLLVPPMTAREHAEVATREASREGEESRLSGWRYLRRLDVDGLPKDELLVVAAPAKTIQPAIDAFVAERMEPRVVVTGPLALMAAAQYLAPSPLDAPTALVHWGDSTLMIVIVSEGLFKFARVVAPPASDLDPLDWMPVEIERSIRHYAIQAKGERVEQVMISVADVAAAGRVFQDGALAQRLRLPFANLNALLAPQFAASVDAEAAGTYVLAYGAALLRASDAPNLLPRVYTVRRRSRQVIVAAALANAASLLLVASAWTSAREEATALRTRVDQVRTEVNAQDARLAETAQLEGERQRMAQRASLLSADPLRLLPAADVLRELARLTPGAIRLEQLGVSAEGQSYVLRLTGGVYHPDVAESQRMLTQFYYGLRSSPLFYDVQAQQISKLPQQQATPSADGEEEAGPTLPFVLVLRSKRLG